MAGSVNRVFIVGHCGKDPEVRTTQGGKIANLTVATSESWNSKDSGEKVTKTEWHRIAILNERIADVAERFVKKGSLIAVEGSLQTRKWVASDGQEKYTTEILIGRFNGTLTLLTSPADNREANGAAPSRAPARAAPRRAAAPAPAYEAQDDLDDAVPF